MEVYYKTLLYHEHHNLLVHHKEGDLKGYQLVVSEGSNVLVYCCNEMASAVTEGAIFFGKKDYYSGDDYAVEISDNRNLNFASLHLGAHSYSAEFYPIKFCSFCGQKVELVEAQKVYVNKEG